MRCTRGAIHDVIIDLRPDSPTFRGHFAVVLDAENRRMLYVPEGFAHGFLTLEDDTEVFYQMSERLQPRARARRALGRPGLRDRLARAPCASSPSATGPIRTFGR